MIVADTDVLIDFLQGKEPTAVRVRELMLARRLATTSISRLELGMGAAGDPERASVQALLDAIPALDFEADAADRAAEVGRSLQETGVSLPMADLAIAGICLSLGVPLLTRNRTHFERVSGLILVG